MTRYRIAVCDDEPSELEDIVQSIKRYDAHGDFDIENYTDGAVLLSDLQLKRNSSIFCYLTSKCLQTDFRWHKP